MISAGLAREDQQDHRRRAARIRAGLGRHRSRIAAARARHDAVGLREGPGVGTEQQKSGPSIWPAHEYPERAVAMAIDLSKCNGCGPSASSAARPRTTSRSWAAGYARRARDVVDARSTATTTRRRRTAVGRRGVDGPLEVVKSADAVPADAVPALRERAPARPSALRGDAAHAGTPEPADLQPLRRHPGIAQQLPLQVRRFNYWS